jgi:glycosyltransferase involved in cell wall biosynthesis
VPDAPIPVLHLVDCLNPGGTESQLLLQLRAVDRRRWRPIVGAFHERGLLLDEVRALDVPVLAFPLRGSLLRGNTLLQVARIASLLRRERVGIVHAHDFYANLVGVAAARLAGAPVIASRRDLAHWLSPSQKRALAIACRAADRVVANARTVASVALDGRPLPPARIDVVPNGIDLARFDEEARPEPDPPVAVLGDPRRRARTVVVVSNMNLPDKGHADLLDAAALLAGDDAPIDLLLVGDGAERPALEARAERLGIAASTHFLGRRRDVPRIVSRVAAAALPSWAEGMPNAVIEAMAAARPVVATRVGGCPELIDDGVTGLLVPPHDPPRLAAALARVLSEPLVAAEMGRAARRRVAERFTVRAAAEAWDAIYRRLCPKRVAGVA